MSHPTGDVFGVRDQHEEKVRECRVWFDESLDALHWSGLQERSQGSLSIDSIEYVTIGKQDDTCLTIVSRDNSMTLVASDMETRDQWVEAIVFIVESIMA